ncbi:MAG: TetR/AcrR family transcriptional regulator [Acidimicrobiales bacterium]|nr:TetR/AcrR family transcriptional regulator [Acidimicrobiales bacterium]
MTAPPARAGRGIDPRVQRSRQVVLAAALELMVERGMFATTIDAVAERSKVAKTTIYRQWPNRDALVADVWAAIPPPSVPPLTGELDADVLAAAGAIHDRLRTPPMSVLCPDLLTAAARDPALAALQDRVLQARRRPLSEIVSRAALDGRLPPGTDAALVAALIVGAIVYRRLVRPGPPEPGDEDGAGPDDRAVVRRLVLAVLASARAGLLTTSDVFCEPSG